MARALARSCKPRALWSLRLLVLCALLIPVFALAQTALVATAATSGSDSFNRANGSLGPNWTDVSDGGLAIVSQAAAGTASAGISGDIRTAESYTSDQYSQVAVTSTQLTGGQWIGPMVRAQNGGQSAYVGIYYWNNGSPVLMLFKRSGGNWTQLGSTYTSGPLAAGTQLRVQAVGSAISFLQNGVQRISATDTSLSGGAPGIMSYGTGQVSNWSGGTATGSGGTTYTVGGTVSGLTGTVVLQDNGGDNLSVSANGPFTFATALASGAAYSVTVITNPTGQTCTVTNGSGTIASTNITNMAVTCTNSATYTVGGTVSGLTGTVVLQDNGGDNLSVTANGTFTFATALASGAAYSVTVNTNPTGQTCTVTSGSGTIASTNITNMAITCTQFSVQMARIVSPGPTAAWARTGRTSATAGWRSFPRRRPEPPAPGTPVTSGPPRPTPATSTRRWRSPRRSSPAASGSGRWSAPRTAGSAPTSGSTTGTAAARC